MNHVIKILTEVIQLFRIKFREQIDHPYIHPRRGLPNYFVSFHNVVKPNVLILSRIGQISTKREPIVGITGG
jgi:hypothetical protein